jgi:naphtho-gamma-pyrone polyketide synthase
MLTLINSYYGDLGHAYPSSGESFIIGLCTGQLASAAVSSSRTVGELIPAGVETVVLALKLGICVLKVQELVESSRSVSSWSVLISGMREPEAQELIQQYSKRNVSFFLKYPEKKIRH